MIEFFKGMFSDHMGNPSSMRPLVYVVVLEQVLSHAWVTFNLRTTMPTMDWTGMIQVVGAIGALAWQKKSELGGKVE